MWFLKVIQKLAESKVQFAVAGGYAVALHGAVRGTVDIDLVLVHESANFEKLEAALLELGMTPRLPVRAKEVYQFRKEYIEKRNMVAWSFIDHRQPAHVIDIVITHDLKKMKVKKISLQGLSVPLLDIQSLIKMKEAAGRPQDIEDVKSLKKIVEESESS